MKMSNCESSGGYRGRNTVKGYNAQGLAHKICLCLNGNRKLLKVLNGYGSA